ncbi:hypothetical protein SFC66_12240 [Terribacillus saccharophilus]|uniref:hypothetical protein n=1 Tax=Terribacillus saccharophilus TaxID=361277 RepID=UPI0039821517
MSLLNNNYLLWALAIVISIAVGNVTMQHSASGWFYMIAEILLIAVLIFVFAKLIAVLTSKYLRSK